MPAPKIIEIPTGQIIDTILNGESFSVDFDLTNLFGKTVDTTDYTDVKIYLYHKQLKKNVGNLLVGAVYHEYWGNVDGNITIAGVDNDQARIIVTEDLTEELKKATYMFMVSLEDTVTPAYEKKKGDAFIIKTAIDE